MGHDLIQIQIQNCFFTYLSHPDCCFNDIINRLASFLGLAALALHGCNSGSRRTWTGVRNYDQDGEHDDTVPVGILHSLTGTMAISESSVVDAEKMAIAEINAAGGVTIDGKSYKIKPIVEDGASDPSTFAEKSKKLPKTHESTKKL